MKNILVPCDFSQASKEAFRMAVDIATKTNGKVTVIHVLQIPELYDAGVTAAGMAYDRKSITALENEAKRVFEEMKRNLGKIQTEIEFEIHSGVLIESIKQSTEENNIDLVLMGTSGATGLKETFIGSNTEKAVRFSKVPVLAIRHAPDLSAVKSILLPTIGALNQKEFMSQVIALQRFFEAKLHVLLINTPANFRRDAESRAILRDFVKHYQLENYENHLMNYFHEDDGIINFARDNSISLIAMATHARKGLSHLFLGSVTEDVVNHIEKPVWTYCLH